MPKLSNGESRSNCNSFCVMKMKFCVTDMKTINNNISTNRNLADAAVDEG